MKYKRAARAFDHAPDACPLQGPGLLLNEQRAGWAQTAGLDDALLRGTIAMKAGLLLEEQNALQQARSVLTQVIAMPAN